jgi:hypothetical protein
VLNASYYTNVRKLPFHLTGKALPVVTETARKIDSFRHLPKGWHYGEGGPAQESAASAAEAILWVFALAEVSDTGAFPGAHGEVMVTAYVDSHYLEAIAETDGSISLTYEVDDAELFSNGRMRLRDAIEKVREILGGAWSTSAFYTLNTLIITPNKIVSRVWLSETQLGAEHLLCNAPVSMQQTAQFATTFGVITPPILPESHPFSGFLTKESSQMDVA